MIKDCRLCKYRELSWHNNHCYNCKLRDEKGTEDNFIPINDYVSKVMDNLTEKSEEEIFLYDECVNCEYSLSPANEEPCASCKFNYGDKDNYSPICHHDSQIDKEYADGNHASYYGGSDNPYEAIKVINAWSEQNGWNGQQGFTYGTVLRYLSRAGHKDGNSEAQDIQKCINYLTMRVADLQTLNESKQGNHNPINRVP